MEINNETMGMGMNIENLYLPSETDLKCAGVLLEMWAAQHEVSVDCERAFFQRKIDEMNQKAAECGLSAWNDAIFADESPTPEEYVAYVLTQVGMWFDDINHSSYCPISFSKKQK